MLVQPEEFLLRSIFKADNKSKSIGFIDEARRHFV